MLVNEQRKEWLLTPDTPVQYLKGVGEARAALLHNAGLTTARDLLYYFPFRYEDRRIVTPIRQLRASDKAVTLRGRVASAVLKESPVRRLKIFELLLDDGSGKVMLVFFNQPYLAEQLRRGDELLVYGQPRFNNAGRLQFESPDFEKLDSTEAEHEGSIVPVYSSVSALTSKVMRRLVQQAMSALAALPDPLPLELRTRLGVIDRAAAIQSIHFPQQLDDDFHGWRSPGHRRVILDEFFAFQLALRLRRSAEEVREKGRSITIDDELRERVRAALPFKLTSAQKRVLREIASDMTSSRPMYRLLQGDVGSGKTIVALIAALISIHNGYQAALLAPTEILAEQHYQRVVQLLSGSGLTIAKLSGSTPSAERTVILDRLARGKIDLIIGTHALLEPRVKFKALGMAIVDEQHRFGVLQRQQLFAKGSLPDILVMTATPIPRSLAIALYGDLELSVIDELPPGRQPVKTIVRGMAQLPKVCSFIDEQVSGGGQAYVVFPLIDESDKLDLTPLTEGVELIRAALPSRRIALLHGRMPFEEKEAVMRAFKDKRIDVLVSTTVVEVGIDVPEATVMAIVDADRFGLAQLHQLRGRVGRGERRSYCILLRDERVSEEAKSRLSSFAKTTDGFAVAAHDLALRGSGDVFGTRQSGAPPLRYGDLLRDHDLMELARNVAIEYIDLHGADAAAKLLASLLPRREERQLAAVQKD